MTEQTIIFYCKRYNITPNEVFELESYISQMQFYKPLNHPILKRIVDVDVPMKNTSKFINTQNILEGWAPLCSTTELARIYFKSMMSNRQQVTNHYTLRQTALLGDVGLVNIYSKLSYWLNKYDMMHLNSVYYMVSHLSNEHWIWKVPGVWKDYFISGEFTRALKTYTLYSLITRPVKHLFSLFTKKLVRPNTLINSSLKRCFKYKDKTSKYTSSIIPPVVVVAYKKTLPLPTEQMIFEIAQTFGMNYKDVREQIDDPTKTDLEDEVTVSSIHFATWWATVCFSPMWEEMFKHYFVWTMFWPLIFVIPALEFPRNGWQGVIVHTILTLLPLPIAIGCHATYNLCVMSYYRYVAKNQVFGESKGTLCLFPAISKFKLPQQLTEDKMSNVKKLTTQEKAKVVASVLETIANRNSNNRTSRPTDRGPTVKSHGGYKEPIWGSTDWDYIEPTRRRARSRSRNSRRRRSRSRGKRSNSVGRRPQQPYSFSTTNTKIHPRNTSNASITHNDVKPDKFVSRYTAPPVFSKSGEIVKDMINKSVQQGKIAQAVRFSNLKDFTKSAMSASKNEPFERMPVFNKYTPGSMNISNPSQNSSLTLKNQEVLLPEVVTAASTDKSGQVYFLKPIAPAILAPQTKIEWNAKDYTQVLIDKCRLRFIPNVGTGFTGSFFIVYDPDATDPTDIAGYTVNLQTVTDTRVKKIIQYQGNPNGDNATPWVVRNKTDPTLWTALNAGHTTAETTFGMFVIGCSEPTNVTATLAGQLMLDIDLTFINQYGEGQQDLMVQEAATPVSATSLFNTTNTVYGYMQNFINAVQNFIRINAPGRYFMLVYYSTSALDTNTITVTPAVGSTLTVYSQVFANVTTLASCMFFTFDVGNGTSSMNSASININGVSHANGQVKLFATREDGGNVPDTLANMFNTLECDMEKLQAEIDHLSGLPIVSYLHDRKVYRDLKPYKLVEANFDPKEFQKLTNEQIIWCMRRFMPRDMYLPGETHSLHQRYLRSLLNEEDSKFAEDIYPITISVVYDGKSKNNKIDFKIPAVEEKKSKVIELTSWDNTHIDYVQKLVLEFEPNGFTQNPKWNLICELTNKKFSTEYNHTDIIDMITCSARPF